MSTTTSLPASTLDTIAAAARACAQGWAEQANKDSSRIWDEWTPIPDADLDYLEREVLGRSAEEEESAHFSRIFRDEYEAVMAQRDARGSFDD